MCHNARYKQQQQKSDCKPTAKLFLHLAHNGLCTINKNALNEITLRIFALLVRYTAWIGTYRRFRRTYRSYLQGSSRSRLLDHWRWDR